MWRFGLLLLVYVTPIIIRLTHDMLFAPYWKGYSKSGLLRFFVSPGLTCGSMFFIPWSIFILSITRKSWAPEGRHVPKVSWKEKLSSPFNLIIGIIFVILRRSAR